MTKASIALLVLGTTIIALACTTGPKTEDTANAKQANKSAQSANTSLLVQPTLKGDIERISLYIGTAREYAKNNKSVDAVGQLQGAKKEVDSALAGKLRLREEFEALKVGIDRTIATIENRDKDADAQLAELQVRISAIKVNTP